VCPPNRGERSTRMHGSFCVNEILCLFLCCLQTDTDACPMTWLNARKKPFNRLTDLPALSPKTEEI